MAGAGARPTPPARRPTPAPAPTLYDAGGTARAATVHQYGNVHTVPCYFSPQQGHDTHGDGSREYPFRTFQTANLRRGNCNALINLDNGIVAARFH